MRHLLIQRDLERVIASRTSHAGNDDLLITRIAAGSRCARSDDGSSVIGPALVGAQCGLHPGSVNECAGVDRGVEIKVNKLMPRHGSDISDPHRQAGSKLLFDGQVKVVGDGHPEVT